MYAFLSRNRKVGQNAWYGDAFLSQAKTFCPGTERRDKTSGTEGLGQNVSVPFPRSIIPVSADVC